jgi:excisionase family DNA binding protein
MPTFDYCIPGGSVVRSDRSNESHGVQKLAVTRDEAARMLSVCSKTLDRFVSDGAIRSIKVGRRRIFPMEGIFIWLQENASSHLPPHPPAAVDSSLPLTVNRQEAARLLSIGTRLLDEVVASGQLPRIQITRKLIFRTADLVDWLRRQSASVDAD